MANSYTARSQVGSPTRPACKPNGKQVKKRKAGPSQRPTGLSGHQADGGGSDAELKRRKYFSVITAHGRLEVRPTRRRASSCHRRGRTSARSKREHLATIVVSFNCTFDRQAGASCPSTVENLHVISREGGPRQQRRTTQGRGPSETPTRAKLVNQMASEKRKPSGISSGTTARPSD